VSAKTTSSDRDTLSLQSGLASLMSKMSVTDEAFGYERLTKTLALDDDLSMFRRFAALNIRNILYLQSELQSLELKLHHVDNESNDISKGNAVWGQPRSWYWASRVQGVPDSGEEREGYWDLVLKIRELLDKYSTSVSQCLVPGISSDMEQVTQHPSLLICKDNFILNMSIMRCFPFLDTALRHQAWLLSLKAPSEQSWSTLHSFIEKNRTMLSEADAKYMDVGTRHDLAALSWREKEVLSLWMEEYLRKLFKKRV